MFCVKCGNKINEGAAFCHLCGAQVSGSVAVPHAQAPPVSQKNNHRVLIIASVCVIVTVIVVLGLVALFGGNRPSNTTVTCAAYRGSCTNPVKIPYDRCSQHLYLCRGCGKQIGSLDYGYCNSCRR